MDYYLSDGKCPELHIKTASSIIRPKDDSVIFIKKRFSKYARNLSDVSGCLVFCEKMTLPAEAHIRNRIVVCDLPRKEFGRFLMENHAEELPPTEYINKNGAFISKDAIIGEDVTIMPMAFVDRDVKIGSHTTICAGAHILPRTVIGQNCIINDNAIIGNMDFAYEDGQRIPQLGGVEIGDDTVVGGQSIISRGAIENTIIGNRVGIDSACYISHNDIIGDNVLIVGGAILFGSVTVGDNAFISGNATIRNGLTLGEGCMIGMGAVVTKSVGAYETVLGNPARQLVKGD